MTTKTKVEQHVPKQLIEKPQWVAWRPERRNGNPTKVPYQVKTGQPASPTNPDHWCTFEEAIGVLEDHHYAGIGFVFTENDPFLGIDIDDCRDPETGKLDPQARQIINAIASYTETSPSRTGVKITLEGTKNTNKCKVHLNNGVSLEVYDHKRYFTVTGRHLEGTPTEIRSAQQAYQKLENKYFSSPGKSSSSQSQTTAVTKTFSDQQIIDAIKSGYDAEMFNTLYEEGDISKYDNDHSKADYALMGMLAQYSGGNRSQMERLFSQSVLGQRKKWIDRKDYRERTIDQVIKDVAPTRAKAGWIGKTKSFSPLKEKREKAPVHKSDLLISDELRASFPPLIQDMLKFASPLSDGPDEFLLMPFIAILGAVIGRQRYVECGPLKLYPVFWTCIFAGSSTMRKSTAITIVKPLFDKVSQYYKEQYLKELKAWKKRRAQHEQQNPDIPFDEPRPVQRRLFGANHFSELTFWEGLRDSGAQVNVAPEFSALWEVLTKSYNGLTDLILQIFDSSDTIRRNTKSGGDIELQNPILNIVGATTLEQFRKKLSETERGSGMLQRIIPVCMEDSKKSYMPITGIPNKDGMLQGKLKKEILELTELNISDPLNEKMVVGSEARSIFERWAKKKHQKAQQIEQQISDFGGYASRVESYAVKFAMVFQILEDPDTSSIGEKAMKAAILLANWVEKHQLYMLRKNYIFDKSYSDRLRIREIISKQPNKTISRSKLLRHSNFSAKRLDMALVTEIQAGNIELIEEDRGGTKPHRKYKLIKENK